MAMFRTFLFGRFHAEADGQPLPGLDGAKVQELYCFLLLHRDRPHSRASLASLLWGDLPEAHARQYLRKALWQLGAALDGPPVDALTVESGWIQFAPAGGHWLDVAQFEAAYTRAEDIPGQKLKPAQAAELRAAVALYRGDLLEGWYQEWCLFERERLERMYLIMLEKLMLFCESQGQYELGVSYGVAALRRDRARERTHRRLIRLHYLSGNRSEALRQYQRCVQALREELGVGPARTTMRLYEQVLAEVNLDAPGPPAAPPPPAEAAGQDKAIRQLESLHQLLAQMQQRIQQELDGVGVALAPPDRQSQRP
jgi:DNA-binding SARP family transcriptional activator